MSAFKLEYNGYDFTIVLDLDSGHLPIDRWTIIDKEDKELLESGAMAYYSVTITSQDTEDKVTHYLPGVQLSTNDEDQAVELEMILTDEGILDEILAHWDLRRSDQKKPSWA